MRITVTYTIEHENRTLVDRRAIGDITPDGKIVIVREEVPQLITGRQPILDIPATNQIAATLLTSISLQPGPAAPAPAPRGRNTGLAILNER